MGGRVGLVFDWDILSPFSGISTSSGVVVVDSVGVAAGKIVEVAAFEINGWSEGSDPGNLPGFARSGSMRWVVYL